jgi:flagellar hook-associated protein FlgK
MHYQQAYQAAAQAIAIGQKLFETIIAAMQR